MRAHALAGTARANVENRQRFPGSFAELNSEPELRAAADSALSRRKRIDTTSTQSKIRANGNGVCRTRTGELLF